MVAIAISSNVLVSFGARNDKAQSILLLVLPLVVSIAFLLIGDIDSPRWGLIRVIPQNLLSLFSIPAYAVNDTSAGKDMVHPKEKAK
jgi:hypothetical protein